MYILQQFANLMLRQCNISNDNRRKKNHLLKTKVLQVTLDDVNKDSYVYFCVSLIDFGVQVRLKPPIWSVNSVQWACEGEFYSICLELDLGRARALLACCLPDARWWLHGSGKEHAGSAGPAAILNSSSGARSIPISWQQPARGHHTIPAAKWTIVALTFCHLMLDQASSLTIKHRLDLVYYYAL